jgi:hypothetical protein
MKKIYYFFIFTLLILLPLNKALAWNFSWEFNDGNNYTQQDTNLTIVDWSLWQLKIQLQHEWSITDWTDWAALNQTQWIQIVWNYAYMTTRTSNALEIIDISDPTNPIHIWKIVDWWAVTLRRAQDLVVDWDYAYITALRDDAIEIVDISDPSNPTHVSSIKKSSTIQLNWAIWIEKVWNYLYVASRVDDWLEIIDVSDPANPTHVSSLTDSTRLNWAEDIKINWNYAYMSAESNDSFEVIDISDPTNPTFVWELADWTNWATLDWASWIELNWNYAYIAANAWDAIEIIDISDPTNPIHVSSITNWWNILLDWPENISIEWSYAYIASTVSDAVEVLNISNPASPTHVTNISNWWSTLLNWAKDIKTIWNHIYVASDTSDALEIIKIYYSWASPYIIPNTFLAYSWSVDKLSTTFSLENQWNVKYQISKDNWTTWYYLSWTTRTTTTAWVLESNTETEINAEIQSFNWLAWWTWEFIWKVFLISNTSQKVEIDKIDMAFTSAWTNEIIDFETPGWYTVTNGTWTRETSEFYEWTYAIEADNWWNDDSVSCFNVNRDIYNDSTISFYRKISSEANYDFLRFYIDWTKVEEWSWDIARWSGSYNIWNWNHDFDWCYEKDWSVAKWSDTAWVDYIEIKELPAPPVEVVVLNFEIEWWYTVTTSVTWSWTDWFRQQNTVYEWDYAIQSADIDDDDSVCFEREQEVTNIDTWISFYRKVSSESGYDFLRFYINWTEQDKWSWDIDWTKQVYSLSPDTYTLKWCYTKDWSVSKLNDAAYIDLVTVTQDPPIITEVTPVATPTNDNTPDYTFNTPIAWEISYSWSCTSSTNTWAVVWDNTITFDTLADWIYTDCTIQILASPQNSTILNISNFTVDTTGIDITFNNPIDWWEITPEDFNIDISYSDDNWVDTWSIDIQLFERDWNSYWPNIAPDFIDFTWAIITETWAIYPTLALTWATQYKIEFSIDDTTWNNSVWTSVFDVSSWDTTPPTITNNFPTNWFLFPNSNFNININYSDSESNINTWSILINLKKWNWTDRWSDVSSTYITWSTITSSNSIYNVSKLWFWKYKVDFYIEDDIWNWTWTTTDFYIDEPEIIISSWSLEIWNLKAWIQKFSTWSLDITVKTVWAWFDLILNKDSSLTTWTIDILDWNWSTWVWYDKKPYSSTISIINNNEIIASETWSINTNWNKNIYIYSIKLWALIWKEQAAWNYSMHVRFWLNLNY